jgi:hypothetical protein
LLDTLGDMDDLDAISEALRRQRKDFDLAADETAARGDETAKVLQKLEELRKRAELTAKPEPIR